MLRISTNLLRLLALTTLAVALTNLAAVAGPSWPLKGRIDLSSGFGDYRDGHFHFGLDLRTGGVVGKPVYSPVNGYVWRVRTEYTGYGKALYIHGDDGYIYVMAHLNDFNNPVDGLVKTTQVARRRYFLDLMPPKDSLRVKKGQLVAYSGQTGVGAPHLHFERRLGDTPLNPLVFGFHLPDKTRPVFQRVGFQMTDDHSVFPNGRRKMFLAVTAGAKGAYRLDTVLYLNRPFGLQADCFDRMRSGGMQQAVYHLALYIDDSLRYQSEFDSVDFKTDAAVGLEYDYVQAVNDHQYVRRLFDEYGNTYAGSGPVDGRRGIFGISDEPPGIHRAKIVATDAFGNTATLTFSFVWGPVDRSIYALDSTKRGTADTSLYYLSPRFAIKPYDLDSANVWLNRGKLWGRTPSCITTLNRDGSVFVRAAGYPTTLTVLQLCLYPSVGGVIRDDVFNGMRERGDAKVTIEHEVVEDGLLVRLDCDAISASRSRLELYDGDTLLGTETPQFLGMLSYVCFVPPKPEYRRIDRLKVILSNDTTDTNGFTDSVNIVAVGFDQDQVVPVDDHFKLHFSRDDFFAPRFIELQPMRVANKALLGLNSDAYRIYPAAFVTRKPFDLEYDMTWPTMEANAKSGLCWLDEKKNKWVWLDNTFNNDTLTAGSIGGGYFAAVFDYEAPRIVNLSIQDGATYQNVRPSVNFIIEDSLSGITVDTDIVIELDGQWLIPEYDPESGRVRSRPLEPLQPGRHHLGIQVTDQVGNKTEQYLNFFVDLTGRKHR